MKKKAPQVKAPAIKTEHLKLVPKIHIVEGENGFLQTALWPRAMMPTHSYTHTHVYPQNQNLIAILFKMEQVLKEFFLIYLRKSMCILS